MLVSQVLSRFDDLIEIHFHVVGDQVDMPKVYLLDRVIVDQILETQHILVVHVTQDTYLPQDPPGIHYIFNLVEFLDGTFFLVFNLKWLPLLFLLS